MSGVSSGVAKVVDRAMQDEIFLSTLRSEPAEAVKQHDLTKEEEKAIISGDEGELSGLLRADDDPAQEVIIVVVL